MNEYLQLQQPEWFGDLPSARELADTGRIVGVAMLSEVMDLAFLQLVRTPGEHMAQRKQGVVTWVVWWSDYLDRIRGGDEIRKLVDSPNAAGLEAIRQKDSELAPDHTSGVLLMATGEGTDGHRFAVDWMRQYVSLPILLLEDEGYFERNPGRRKAFFPEQVRLSLWATYGVLTGIIPDKPESVDEDKFYRRLVGDLGVDYSFASDSDPKCEEKIARGRKAAFFTRIPEWMSQHTSDRTQRLM